MCVNIIIEQFIIDKYIFYDKSDYGYKSFNYGKINSVTTKIIENLIKFK